MADARTFRERMQAALAEQTATTKAAAPANQVAADAVLQRLHTMAKQIADRDGVSEPVAFVKAVETPEGRALHTAYATTR